MIWRDKGCLVLSFGGCWFDWEAAEEEAPPPKVVVVIWVVFWSLFVFGLIVVRFGLCLDLCLVVFGLHWVD